MVHRFKIDLILMIYWIPKRINSRLCKFNSIIGIEIEWCHERNNLRDFTYITYVQYFYILLYRRDRCWRGKFFCKIFVKCFDNDMILRQCRKIGEISYMIEWYRLMGNKKLFCILIIAMSNSSIKLTAGNIVNLSISTFTDVSIDLFS